MASERCFTGVSAEVLLTDAAKVRMTHWASMSASRAAGMLTQEQSVEGQGLKKQELSIGRSLARCARHDPIYPIVLARNP